MLRKPTKLSILSSLAIYSIALLTACGDSSDEQESDVLPVTTGTAYDPALVDYGLQSSLDAQKLAYLTRRSDGRSQVVLVDRSLPEGAQQQRLELATEQSSHEMLTISADGELIAYVERGQNDQIKIRNFAGTVTATIDFATEGQTQRLAELRLAADGQYLIYSLITADANGRPATQKSYVVHLQADNTTYTLATSDALDYEGGAMVVRSGNPFFVGYTVTDEEQTELSSLSFSYANGSFSFDPASSVKPVLNANANRHPMVITNNDVFAVSPLAEVITRQRTGNQSLAEGESEEDLLKMEVSEQLLVKSLVQAETSISFSSDSYNSYVPATISAISASQNGKYVLVLGPNYYACEVLVFSGAQFLLVNTETGIAFPFTVRYKSADLTPEDIVQQPCLNLNEELPAISQPFDFRISEARLYQKQGSDFVITYTSRLQGNPDVYLMELSLPNIDEANIEPTALEIESVSINRLSGIEF